MDEKVASLNELKAKVDAITNTEEYKSELKDMIDYEKHWQTIWAHNKIFESNVPESYKPGEERKKYLATFPYPYMNGRLHLGHMFSMTKTEFAVAWHKMNGFNALFPFGFHVTGQPICGAAKKLEEELEKYGNPPDYEKVREEEQKKEEEEKKKEKVENLNVGEFKGKKTKALQKTGGQLTYKILEDLGVPDSEIPQFVDPLKWVEYFPEECKRDLEILGLRADWRRTFITTDINPYYDAFIQWQYRLLEEAGLVTFGKRNVIWSPLDQQPCTDHDRLSGEGVKVYEYTVVMAELLKNEEVNKKIYAKLPEDQQNLTIYLGCATLRPETMIGQTNIWIEPESEYLIIKIDDKRALVCGEHAAENLSYEGFNAGGELGQIIELTRINGEELLNCLIRSPKAINKEIPVLPLFTIDMCKGTGVVSSVPSDSPDDYEALKDVKTNVGGVRDKYNIDISKIGEIIEIIDIPGIGRAAAARLCEETGVRDQYDKEKLKALKEECYTKGFYEGVMVAGDYAGKKVSECKQLCRESLLESGDAINFGEPESPVIARSGSKCVVASTEQYFLDYGSSKWKEMAHQATKDIEFFHPEVRNQFSSVIDWLDQWPLSRTFGLGSYLPGAEKTLIESLSDSTIYNAYYTISDILENGSLRGEAALIEKEYINDEFFNYVFCLSEEKPKNIPDDVSRLLDKARAEFEYFYPVDVRCSGKDLLTNHLAFYVFHHTAIWPNRPDLWPKGIRVNGHLQVNGEKMSKSLGNLILASDAAKLYGADGVRVALADGGDGTEGGEFYEEVAAEAVGKLEGLRTQLKELLDSVGGFKGKNEQSACPWASSTQENSSASPEGEAVDGVFRAQLYDWAARINRLFSNCLFREGAVTLWAELPRIRDLYIKTSASLGLQLNRQLIRQLIWLTVRLLSVFCPHTAEQINEECLTGPSEADKYVGLYSAESGCLDEERLEQLCKDNSIHLTAYNFMEQAIQRLKARLQDVTKQKKDGTVLPKPETAVIYVATAGPAWREPLIQFLKELFVNSGNELPKSAVGDARKHALSVLGAEEREAKAIMKVITDIISLSKSEGASAFEGAPIDELKLYETYRAQICSALLLHKVDVFRVGDGPVAAAKCGAAQPGRPIIFFDVNV